MEPRTEAGEAEAPETSDAEAAVAGAEADAAEVAEPAGAALEVRLAELERANADLEDRLLRTRAEFENYRKRTARELAQTQDRASQEVVRRFLDVVDNFDRAMAAAEAHGVAEDHVAGWRLIHQQLYDVLRSLDVQPMAVIGEPFDPRFHEAVGEAPHAEVPAGHVAAEVQRGYMLGDAVVRIARVLVSRGPAEA